MGDAGDRLAGFCARKNTEWVAIMSLRGRWIAQCDPYLRCTLWDSLTGKELARHVICDAGEVPGDRDSLWAVAHGDHLLLCKKATLHLITFKRTRCGGELVLKMESKVAANTAEAFYCNLLDMPFAPVALHDMRCAILCTTSEYGMGGEQLCLHAINSSGLCEQPYATLRPLKSGAIFSEVALRRSRISSVGHLVTS